MTSARWVVAHVCAVGLAVAAGIRVRRLERNFPFDQLVRELRGARRLPTPAADPAALARVVGRLAPVLPPWGMGLCFKRSLLLVHLWARCGLDPRLHLGILAGRRGHAWVTAGPFSSGPPGPAAEVTAL